MREASKCCAVLEVEDSQLVHGMGQKVGEVAIAAVALERCMNCSGDAR